MEDCSWSESCLVHEKTRSNDTREIMKEKDSTWYSNPFASTMDIRIEKWIGNMRGSITKLILITSHNKNVATA